MAFQFNSTIIPESQSSHMPPLFDGTDYSYWKTRMMIFIKAIEIALWKMVIDGYTPIENPVGLVQIAEQEKLENLNAKATYILYCGLSKTEFNRISNCTTTKEIWTLLGITHEGTSQVKKSRIAILMK